MKKEEGKAFDLNTEETTQKVLEVGTSTNETKIDDKTSFENFKVLYDGRIKEKCLADYGTVEDKELLEDTAKELYLTSQELIPTEDTKSEGVLEDEKTKKEEGKMELDNKSKFLAHILNGVISDVQNKFNVIATGELDTADKNKVAVTLKGSTLDLIDATSYLAKAIRRDDVDFTFDDEIKNNTVRCIISPKTKTESKDNEGSEYDYMLLSRLKSDCDYFLGNGNRYEKHLWAGNIDDQIAKMKELYNKLPEKPEWLTMEDIENYEKEMKQDVKTESKTKQPKTVKEFRIMDGDKVLKVFSADQENEGYKEMRRMGAELKEKGLPDNLMYKEFRVKNKQVEESLTEAKDGKENPEYKAFAEDMNEIERTINFIKQPKNKDAQEVLADIKDYLNKLWVEKEQHTFGIKYDESKKIEETVTIDEISKIHSEINQANSLKEIQDVIDKISDKSLQRQVQITFDEYDKDDDEDMDEDLEEVKDEIIQTLEDNAEYDDEEEPLTEASTPNVEKFIYDLDVDSGNAWSVNYNDRKRGVEVYKNGKSEKTVDDIIKAVTSKYPQLKVSMKGKNTVLFKYDDKNKSLKEESPNTNKIDNIVAQLMEELPDFAQGYRDIIMELGLSKEDFIDMITTENEHQLLKDKNITEDEEKEVYGKIYDTLV